MEDEKIVELYWQRNEQAISETEKKYGLWLLKIAENILKDTEDSREVINDTYFKAWCTMPDKRPVHLGAYLSGIARSGAIDIWRSRHRKKRSPDTYLVSLEELEECIPDKTDTEEIVEGKLLEDAIDWFLRTLSKEARTAFLCRYYYTDSLKEIAGYLGTNERRVRNLLYTVRKKLKEYLKKEGFVL